MKNKKCTKCGIISKVSNFHKNKAAKDGLASNCKPCRKITQKRWKESTDYDKLYYKKNSDEIKKRASDYKKNNKDRVKKVRRDYYQKNKEYIDAKNNEWVSNNKERSRDIKRNYAKRNPEVKLRSKINRRSKERLATPEWSESDKIRTLIQKVKELSSLTGIEYHIDHIEPIRGVNVCGLHVWANLQVLEASLNLKKNNKENYYIKLEECDG